MALFAMERSAQATITTIISPTTVNYTTDGTPLSIIYGVTEDSGLYTYTYDLSSTVNLSSFTLAAFTDSIIITGVGVDSAYAAVNANTVVWDWKDQSTSEDVSFTSDYAPGNYPFSVNDDSISWDSPPTVAAPAPVPEASTVMAGALMLLPFGVGAIRSLRKERAV